MVINKEKVGIEQLIERVKEMGASKYVMRFKDGTVLTIEVGGR